MSAEARAKMSAASKGRKKSPEHCAKISAGGRRFRQREKYDTTQGTLDFGD